MRYLLFFALTTAGVFKCTGAGAVERDCKQVTQELRKIAWDDADSYDFENLKDQGTVKYMCGDATDVTKALCAQARKAGCK